MKRYSKFFESNIEFFDAFKKFNAPMVQVIDSHGNERMVPSSEAYTSEYMVKSDITGKNVRWVAIKDGKQMSIYSAYGIRTSNPRTANFKLFEKMPYDDLIKLLKSFDFSRYKVLKEFDKKIENDKDVDLIFRMASISAIRKGKGTISGIFRNIAEGYYNKGNMDYWL